MEQHAVPQPITSYEFRLVGDMTIRQFGKLAFGVILALIVYGINPAPWILKWALIILFSALGAGMAFLPFQGRPLDTWIIAFFTRIYSPTQYVWRMGGQAVIKPSYEEVIETPNTLSPRPKVDRPLGEVVGNQQSRPKADRPLDETTNNKQQAINNSVSGTPISQNTPITPTITTNEISSWHEGKPLQPVKPVLTEPVPEETPAILYDSPSPRQSFSDGGQYPQTPQIPTIDQVSVGKTTIYSADTQQSTKSNSVNVINNQYPIPNTRPTVPPAFNPSLIIPTLPKIPNILGGFVKNTEGKLVEGAIIEVRDSNLNPVRAFKTNKLGQFQIATPLPNGVYEIETEKDKLTFDIIKIEMKGEILPPFEIIAKQA